MTKPRHIALFILTFDQVGGAEVAIWRLACGLTHRGQTVTLITTQAITEWRARRGNIIEWRGGVRIIRLPVWQRSRAWVKRMLQIELWIALRFLNIDVLHVRGLSRETIAAAKIANRFHIKTICTLMAGGAYGDLARLPLNTPIAFDRVTCFTPALAGDVIARGYPHHRIAIIPNGVDTETFTPTLTSPDPHSAIYVGQFRPEKRIDLLLRAWQRVQAQRPDARLTLVGGIERAPHYRQLAADLGVRVTFTPLLSEHTVRDQLRNHAVFIQPGVSEGMSNALLEAMACGLAPVVSDTPANRAVITPGDNGLCYEAESADALAPALLHLFTHPDQRAALGKRARDTVIENYRLESIIDRIMALYPS